MVIVINVHWLVMVSTAATTVFIVLVSVENNKLYVPNRVCV
jgi:hypothetical protein